MGHFDRSILRVAVLFCLVLLVSAGLAYAKDRGGGIGGINPGSCAPADCGVQSPDGCWCDSLCATINDCCANVQDVCGYAVCNAPRPVEVTDDSCYIDVATQDSFCCASDWDLSCQEQYEACLDPIPTINQWGVIVLSLILAAAAFLFIRKKVKAI